MSTQDMETKIARLEASKTGILMADLMIAEEIHELQMKLDDITPRNTEISCIGCSG